MKPNERVRALGHDVRALRMDQVDEPSTFAVRDSIVRESGQLHILINNAVARPVKKGCFDDVAVIDESFHGNEYSGGRWLYGEVGAGAGCAQRLAAPGGLDRKKR
jgi:hypothetical protein